ncbi:hypothetical protein GG496_001523 [Candidatus Fervidibacteria bacterium JGI MDM2 JNZ-1-D12]
MSKPMSKKKRHYVRTAIKKRLKEAGYLCLRDLADALQVDYFKLRSAIIYNQMGIFPHAFKHAGMWFVPIARVREALTVLEAPSRMEAIRRWERYISAVQNKNTG